VQAIGGIIIFFIFIGLIFSSGIISNFFEAFSVFGALGGVLALLFILMIIVSVWEAINKR
jgi:hypothetical protein